MRILKVLILLAFGLAACQDSTNTTDATTDGANIDSTAMETPAMKYTLTPFSSSVDFPDARMESMAYKNGKFTFNLNSNSTYKLGQQTSDAAQKMCANSDQGQHIHVIVDNEPYAARYTPTFSDFEVASGEHYVLAFLSRSYHESLKHEGAGIVEKVNVANKSIASREPVTTPMLFYSRPKGDYLGKKETEKVMLDFYMVNAQLGNQYQLKAEINGEAHMIDRWQPYYIEGLPLGDNTIKLSLLTTDGNLADVPLNPVERTFTLKEDPITEQQ